MQASRIGDPLSSNAGRLGSRRDGRRPSCGCFGCLGSLLATVVASTVAYVLFFPFSFRLGDRWTPLGRWEAVGRLRDPAGFDYGLYTRFGPNVSIDSRTDSFVFPCCNLSGKAQVCTAGGARYRFDVDGRISGAWLRTDGSKVSIRLTEPGRQKLPRHFELMGDWRGPNLVLDDQKSMFMNFLPGGNLTPAPSYTSPVPERHAQVTLAWGNLGDFESMCASLHNTVR
jgi:hypothetical protein